MCDSFPASLVDSWETRPFSRWDSPDNTDICTIRSVQLLSSRLSRFIVHNANGSHGCIYAFHAQYVIPLTPTRVYICEEGFFANANTCLLYSVTYSPRINRYGNPTLAWRWNETIQLIYPLLGCILTGNSPFFGKTPKPTSFATTQMSLREFFFVVSPFALQQLRSGLLRLWPTLSCSFWRYGKRDNISSRMFEYRELYLIFRFWLSFKVWLTLS